MERSHGDQMAAFYFDTILHAAKESEKNRVKTAQNGDIRRDENTKQN